MMLKKSVVVVDNAGYSYYEEGDNWTPTTQDGKDYFKDQYWMALHPMELISHGLMELVGIIHSVQGTSIKW